MMNRSRRAAIAKETLEILKAGRYTIPTSNQEVEIEREISDSITGTITYSPEMLSQLEADVQEKVSQLDCDTQFEVENETTFASSKKLLQQRSDNRVLCLNFASAKNPGGGFLGGSQAQEEALSRASALYLCLEPQQEYYEMNRKSKTCFYTDYMIYSPMVPVFRDDSDALVADPYCVSIVTAPAVNTGAVANSEHERLGEVPSVMLNRSGKLLSLAVANDYRALVLGAWGCGVFRNDPNDMADYFCQHLGIGGKFEHAFEQVHFGVLDFTKHESTYRAFADKFANQKAV